MSDAARTRIYNRLRTALSDAPSAERVQPGTPTVLNPEERVTHLAELMAAVRTEVYRVKRDAWLSKLTEIIKTKKIGTLLYGPGTAMAAELEESYQEGLSEDVHLKPYGGNVESLKKELFEFDAGITTTLGGIADRGALVLWPTPQEPRLLSLVPPIHIAVLDAETIYSSLTDTIEEQNWSQGMPTNALLISGPSKTADIEFTLVFGVHGPKELVVIIRED